MNYLHGLSVNYQLPGFSPYSSSKSPFLSANEQINFPFCSLLICNLKAYQFSLIPTAPTYKGTKVTFISSRLL